ncbi:MAG: 1-deoxy-D-xylulose-5-phosphate reductoisomerase [Clostridiales Family XIII bacterium]|jgi:1-deoxy-D-xylulose-5-phosphate reductoisomerase|nr:1-deoxy-D-xylulose-5-phosphate reductoisomerase [Clostridiales Family XIII bacterium]
MNKKRIAIFGSTGSIGTQALELIAANPDRFEAVFLSCRENVMVLTQQIEAFHPKTVCCEDEEDAEFLRRRHPGVEVLCGPGKLAYAAAEIPCDIMLNALVGIAGLVPTASALVSGRDPEAFHIALANKETLVAGGAYIMNLVQESGIGIFPVDSEHSAVFRALAGESGEDVKQIILTGSGGPFRGYSEEELRQVTREEALAHPTWHMGGKITIDSATLINKCFEVIEARWLFHAPAEKIRVLIHPQSIVHGMALFRDGASVAQLGIPSMKVPIAYSLNWPDGLTDAAPEADLAGIGTLTFEEPAGPLAANIELAYKVIADAEEGLTSTGAFLNGANEELVARFLSGGISFMEITDRLQELVKAHKPYAADTLEAILDANNEGREKA